MKFFIYSAGTEVHLNLDDTVILEKTLRGIAGEIKSAVWNEDFHLALQYCNMYIDLEMAIDDFKATIAKKETIPDGEESGDQEDLEGDQEGE